MNQTENFRTSDLFLVLWLTTPKDEGVVPITDYERRGRYVTFEFEQSDLFKSLHLQYINNQGGNVSFLKSLKIKYDELKGIIFRGEKLPPDGGQ